MIQDSPTLKILIIIQARMASTRLPGKSLKTIKNQPILSILLQRLSTLKHHAEIVVATSEEDIDQAIVDFCKEHKVSYFTGSEDDVLDRYLKAARKFSGDIIVRLTGDCPLMDPRVVDQAIDQFLEHYPSYDYVSNAIKRTFPRGLDVEVFKRRVLEQAHQKAYFTEEREHVTPYIWRHPEIFHLGNIFYKEDYSRHRWTLDTQEDFDLIKLIVEHFWDTNPHFTMEEVLALLDQHPEWVEINSRVKQKGT